MTDFINEFLTKLFFNPVGTDQFGNRYFTSKRKDSFNRYTRRVLYKGIIEPSKVFPLLGKPVKK
jgi:NADH:ubiquinone oxidoreductase subunit